MIDTSKYGHHIEEMPRTTNERRSIVKMKPGDFVAIHTEDGSIIAKLVSDEDDTVTCEIGTIFGNRIYYGIPKAIVTLHVSV